MYFRYPTRPLTAVKFLAEVVNLAVTAELFDEGNECTLDVLIENSFQSHPWQAVRLEAAEGSLLAFRSFAKKKVNQHFPATQMVTV